MSRILGLFGEKQAEKFLKKLGYKIIENNSYSRFGEIDIIAQQGNTLHFIEVKNRSRDLIPGRYAVNATFANSNLISLFVIILIFLSVVNLFVCSVYATFIKQIVHDVFQVLVLVFLFSRPHVYYLALQFKVCL